MKPREKILELLKDKEIRSTTRISGTIYANYVVTLKILEELEKEGKVKKMPSPDGKITYWRIK